MQRPSVYTYTVKEPPGVNVYYFRTKAGLGMRQLAEMCKPSLEHTTIHRVEHNKGYTQDSLERIAKALGVSVTVLFCRKISRRAQ